MLKFVSALGFRYSGIKTPLRLLHSRYFSEEHLENYVDEAQNACNPFTSNMFSFVFVYKRYLVF